MYRRLYWFVESVPLYSVILAGALWFYIAEVWLAPSVFNSLNPSNLPSQLHFSVSDVFFVIKMLAEFIALTIISRYVELVIRHRGQLSKAIDDWFINKIVDEQINSTE